MKPRKNVEAQAIWQDRLVKGLPDMTRRSKTCYKCGVKDWADNFRGSRCKPCDNKLRSERQKRNKS